MEKLSSRSKIMILAFVKKLPSSFLKLKKINKSFRSLSNKSFK